MKFYHIKPQFNITTFEDLEIEMRNMNWDFARIDDFSVYDRYSQLRKAIDEASMREAKDNPEGVLDLWNKYAVANGKRIPDELLELIQK